MICSGCDTSSFLNMCNFYISISISLFFPCFACKASYYAEEIMTEDEMTANLFWAWFWIRCHFSVKELPFYFRSLFSQHLFPFREWYKVAEQQKNWPPSFVKENGWMTAQNILSVLCSLATPYHSLFALCSILFLLLCLFI